MLRHPLKIAWWPATGGASSAATEWQVEGPLTDFPRWWDDSFPARQLAAAQDERYGEERLRYYEAPSITDLGSPLEVTLGVAGGALPLMLCSPAGAVGRLAP